MYYVEIPISIRLFGKKYKVLLKIGWRKKNWSGKTGEFQIA